MEYKLEENIT